MKNPIYVFPEMKLSGLVPNSYIHGSVSDLYILRISLPIWLQQNRVIDHGNIALQSASTVCDAAVVEIHYYVVAQFCILLCKKG
jgi:hypothetical protein